MKDPVYSPTLTAFARRTRRLAPHKLLGALLAGFLMAQAHPAFAVLSFTRGTATAVGCVQYSSSPDSVIITGDYTAPGVIDNTLSIPAKRMQYDIINCDLGTLTSWTLYYPVAVGPSIIGAATPIGYVNASGTRIPQGGAAYGTLFNAGYGIYNWNPGAPWTIDYEADHITFTYNGGPPGGLPANAGVGELAPTPYLPSFDVEFSPDLTVGLDSATATVASALFNGSVYGPQPGNRCLSIQCSNIVVYTCSNCITVPYNATAVDPCCTNVTLVYDPPETYCFPLNTTTPVTVTAHDTCGNSNVTKSFLVSIVPGPDCASNNCIYLSAPNILAYTCSNCTTVAFNPTVADTCCSNVSLVYNPPETTCFPQNTITPVTVTALDACGNVNTKSFTVNVLPSPNCISNSCISVSASNIVMYTCSNCTTVAYNATASGTCCSNITLNYNPPETTCFPQGSTTPVTVTAFDACGNMSVPSTFTVTILPAAGCGNNNCISVSASNIVVFTCSNCTTVAYNATALDTCCASVKPLVYNPPETFCFPVNSTTPVTVMASDDCGNASAPVTFTVTVVPGPNCLGGQSGLGISGGPGPAGSGSSVTLTWPPVKAQLQQATDMRHWFSIPGATNPPYAIPNPPLQSYFRLKYN